MRFRPRDLESRSASRKTSLLRQSTFKRLHLLNNLFLSSSILRGMRSTPPLNAASLHLRSQSGECLLVQNTIVRHSLYEDSVRT
jgi:hypothetical protein